MVIKNVRVNEEGRIGSLDVQLSNGHVTSRHRWFLKRDLPVRNTLGLAEPAQHGEGTRPVDIALHGQALRPTGVQTRNMRRKAGHIANKSLGKFRVHEAEKSSKLPYMKIPSLTYWPQR